MNLTTLARYLDRAAIARDAFYGSQPRLSDAWRAAHGYTWDGQWYPSTGGTLAEYTTWTATLDGATLIGLLDPPAGERPGDHMDYSAQASHDADWDANGSYYLDED